MRIRRLLAWGLCGVLLLSLFVPTLALLARAADYADWAATHNRERYRGTTITAAEKALYTAPAEGVPPAVGETARKITDGIKGDLARLAAIYDWVAANIAYDYDYYDNCIREEKFFYNKETDSFDAPIVSVWERDALGLLHSYHRGTRFFSSALWCLGRR